MRENELFPVTLGTMTDEDLWSLFIENREKCAGEVWREVENRKAAGILSEASPFWGMNTAFAQREKRPWPTKSNVIELTPEEWQVRKRRKMFRLISA